MRESLTGVWLLRSYHLEDVATGERSEPFGSHPAGTLILDPNGRMVALLTAGDRSAPANEADQAAAFQELIAYSGRYRLEPPDRFVTTVDMAWFQPWVGTRQARTFSLDGDTLDIVSDPVRLPKQGADDVIAIGTLSWVREKPYSDL